MDKRAKARLRKCPACHTLGVEVDELMSGARCLSCHRIVEVNVVYSCGLSILLGVLVWWSFRNDYGPLGLFFTALVCIYSAGYKKIISNHFPLKVYGG